MKLNPKSVPAGNTLIVTVITLAVVAAFVGFAVEYTNNVARNVHRSILLRQAVNIADSSTEMSFAAWRNITRSKGNVPLKKSFYDNELPTPTPGNFPNVPFYTLSNYYVYPLDSKWKTLTGGSATPAPIAGPNHGDISFYFLASADVVIPTVNAVNKTDPNDPGTLVAKVRRVFQKETLSLWRYAIFFNDDLEMHPGPQQVVTGDVHTNGALYTGHDTLTLNGRTSYTTDWSIGFKSGDNQHPETPTSPHWPSNLPPASDQAQQAYGVDLPDYHELIEPTQSASDPLGTNRFRDQAGAVVTIDNANAIKIYNANGTDITNYNTSPPKGASANDIALSSVFKSAITTGQTITDNREGATVGNGSVRLATLDVSKVTNALNSNSNLFNRIIYVVDTSATDGRNADGSINTSQVKRGIRLKNGAKLPDGGLTIVSGNPIYVQGDYNTGSVLSATPGATPTTQPPSNTTAFPFSATSPPSSTVNGYDRQPAAIIADAVNVLSNSWIDSNSGSYPTAAATTVNAGIISGQVPSGSGYYSGGVENFPRFLENWSSKNFTYYGSMIELYQSKQAVGYWGASNVYSPPNRAWYFDTNFVSNPPPGILNSINYRRSRWYML
ncbi:MAG: hypothetical protein M3Y86_07190 [Verrucomicrobiota bacterium]|nr:hypothetical protein [Verrucomicrobiota bacterium]